MSELLDRVLLPVATPDDAEATSAALLEHVADDVGTVVAINVIEKGGGAIDKAPMDARKDQAEQLFRLARSALEPAGYDVETRIAFGTDVVETIHEAAEEADATAIAVLPRKGSFLVRFLTGNVAKKLMMESQIPVLALPHTDDEQG